MPDARPGGPLRARRSASAGAFLGYLVLSFLYFGVPVLAHPGRSYIGRGADPQIFIWSFAWWPHAILHGQNPFVTHALWAPTGVDLAWTGTSPGLAVLFSPLTILAGPVVSYNVAAVLMPALAAWTCFLLCRYLTRSFWPSLAGGYLFGFSSYMLGEEEGHLHLTAVALLPLVALVLLRYLRGDLGRGRLIVQLGLLLAAQLYCSTELLFTVTLALAVALLAGYAVIPAERRSLVALLVPIVRAYALAAVLGMPLLYFALRDFVSGSVNSPENFDADLANFVVPTRLVRLGGGWAYGLSQHFTGGEPEQGAYLGLPTLVIAAWFLWRRRTAPTGRWLAVLAGIGALAALGGELYVDGHRISPLPWRLITNLPLFDNVLTVRLMLFLSLEAAVVVALWASQKPASRWLVVTLPALAVLSVVPQVSSDLWKRTPERPSFFTTDAYRSCLAPGANVLILPYGAEDDAMLWQAEAGFRFRMAGGYVSPAVPAQFDRYFYADIRRLLENRAPDGGARELLGFARAEGVSTILVDARAPEPWRHLLSRVATGRSVGGMLVYPVSKGAPACRKA